MSYAEAIQFLYRLQMFGAHFGLEHAFRLSRLMGCPHARLRFIHVAGTNGKGSTCAMLESIYRQAGLRVGLFTSPHLVSFRERLQVNRQMISEADAARLVAKIREVNQDHETTLFEFATVMALVYFAEQHCDLVIWETGLGGRLDATNIVTPLASVITNIAFDHQQWLGETLAKIAAEKAGIIKPGVPVVTAVEAPDAVAVIQAMAQQGNSPLTQSSLASLPSDLASLDLPLPGAHQRQNAALAGATVKILLDQIPVTNEQLREGLLQVHWPGRLQLIHLPGGRRFLLDGAHNPAGAKTLADTLKQQFKDAQPVLIFGALMDKNWRAICDTLAPLAKKVLTVPVASKRTADPGELAGVFRSANPQVAATAVENLAVAVNVCKNEPLVVVTGSLYLIGEALELLGQMPADAAGRDLNEWKIAENRTIRT